MPFAAFGVAQLLMAAATLFIISTINVSAITDALLTLILVGRIPGTEVQISFEAFFGGVIFFAWALVTYNFTMAALVKIRTELKHAIASQQELEEVAL